MFSFVQQKNDTRMSASATTNDMRESLGTMKTVLWTLIFLFAGIVFFYTFWSLLASTYAHTYQRPATAPTGNLYSQRFSADFFFTGSLLLLFFVPLTLAFVLDNPYSKARQTFHIVFVMLLIIYFVVILLFWGIGFYATANDQTAGNANNPANDDRWCCVNYVIAGTSCDVTVACPGVSQGMLGVNPVFLYKFWFLFVMILLLIVEFAYVASKFPPLAREYAKETATTMDDTMQMSSVESSIKNRLRTPYRMKKLLK